MIALEIAGIHVALDVPDAIMAGKIRARYGAFIVAHRQPQLIINVVVVPGAQFVTPRPGPWVIETSLHDDYLTFRSYYDAGGADFARREAFLELAPDTDVENFLRVVYAHLCLRAGGLLLHAAGIIRNRRGFVFFGPSGSGKSTTAQLSLHAGHTVLSDDLVIIRKQLDAFRVYGVPFRGSFLEAPRTRADAELAGLYTLAKDTSHWVEPLTPSQAVAHLVRSAPFVMSSPHASAQVMAFCHALAATVRVGELHFQKDPDFWSVIDESLRPVPTPT